MARFKRFFDIKNYLRYLFKCMETRKLSRDYRVTQPQFFITGLPRTGTTLVYQYIVHRLDVAYLTNKTGDYFMTPCTVTALSRRFLQPYQSDFSSHYGKVSGLMAPREAGAFWLRFFDIHAYTDYLSSEKDSLYEDTGTMVKTVHCIQHIFNDAPFVNKNVKHILRLDALKHIFANSVFIIIERDLCEVALSVLEGRKTNTSNPDQWWSVRPPSYEQLKTQPYLNQVAHQVIDLHRKLHKDLQHISTDRVIRLDYREFCQNPEGIIEEIIKRCPSITFKNPAVNSFQYRKRQPSNPEEKQLVEKVEQLL